MQFGFRLLKQVLFGEKTIPLRAGAAEKRIERYKQRLAQDATDNASNLANAQDKMYGSLD